MIPILFSDAISQIFENSQTAAFLTLVENTVLFIFLSTAVFFIVSTPIVLFYLSVDHYFKSKKNFAILEQEFHGKSHTHHPEYSQKIKDKYTKNYTGYMSNLLGLIGWNLFSIAYIVTGWDDLQSGILGYFQFPFQVFETYNFDNSIQTIISYDSNWFFMLIIFVVTIVTFQLGKYIAPIMIQKQLAKGEEVVAIA